ncbi:hypothetical protein GCM10010400_46780 [Streptomyces aculeolatus]|uniref:hypothetical protein n=1 Tax=Streptomyces aculeolatus TaxID=270689 RepID=UPI001CECD479|nr:hypothetical protein [Streptomyces aculeolatus]
MTTQDPADHVAKLYTMSRDFAELGTQVRAVECAPGPEALRAISPLVFEGHQLTAAAVLHHLNALDAGPITKVTGSLDGLHGMAMVVSSAAVAVQELTSAWPPTTSAARNPREFRNRRTRYAHTSVPPR